MTQATSILVKNTTDVLNFTPSVNIKTILFSNIVLHIIPTFMRVIVEILVLGLLVVVYKIPYSSCMIYHVRTYS